jgi:hypothetical protein
MFLVSMLVLLIMHFLLAKCPHNDCVYCVSRLMILAGLQEAGEGPDPILRAVGYQAKLRGLRELDSSVRVWEVCDPEVTR